MLIIVLLLTIALSLSLLYKDLKESKKLRKIDIAICILSITAAILSSYDQYKDKLKEQQIRQAELKLNSLKTLHASYIDILDNTFIIIARYPTVYNYFSYTEGLPIELRDKYGWEKRVSDSQKKELQEAEESFNKLQRISREILNLSLLYEDLLPQQLNKWAEITLDLKFKDTVRYFDPYNDNGDNTKYFYLIGEGFGRLLSNLRNAHKDIKDP